MDATGQPLLDALEDERCLSILAAADEVATSASELSAACDLSASTTYRKVDRLVGPDS